MVCTYKGVSFSYKKKQARSDGLCLSSQHFGRVRRVDHLRSGVQDQPDQHGNSPLSLLKIQKEMNRVWWCAPVVLATREAEAGKLLELGRQRFVVS